jgi:uncharacterized protein (TIGR03000 family)
MTAGPVLAQRGGHGGGGHGGGFHGGGHVGGFHGGGFGGYRGGYYGGYHNYGYHPYGGYRPYGYRSYYGSYPYYYGSYPYYDYYPYYSLGSGSGSADSATYGAVAPSYSYGSTASSAAANSDEGFLPPVVTPEVASAQTDNTAHVTVNVPAGAEVWFGGTETTSTGPVREFRSPALTPGSRYTYEIQARWHENGHEVTQTKQVEVTAGTHVNVDFPLSPKTVGQASTAPKG